MTSKHIPETASSSKLTYESIEDARNFLVSRTTCRPTIGIICGSGLGGLVDVIENKEAFDYSEIPHFPKANIQGHAGKLVFGTLKSKSVVCMQGRVHGYEGVPMWKLTFPVRVMKLLGVKILIVTNACGNLNKDYNVGDIMIIKDHINLPGLTGLNPLIGLTDERFGARFVSMSDGYDPELRVLSKKVAKELTLDYIREGIYIAQIGPVYETVAESRMGRILGADVFGMSTAPEVVVARQCGIRCLGLSLVTNKCVIDYDTGENVNHEEVIEAGKQRAHDIQKYVARIVEMVD